MLRECLLALAAGDEQPEEIIVVDDGSTDASAATATSFGANVLSTGGRRGPAFARNLGAKAAKGNILLFLDADVCVHQDTISRIRDLFRHDETLDAVIGAYDDSPAEPDFLSQYRNLMHCYVHRISRREASTFWTGCGAIRREIFLAHDGFDDAYGRPAIEDIELGYRLHASGRRILLDSDIQVKHLKRWTFWNLVKTDIFDRGIPWTELILRHHQLQNDLNLQLSQRVSIALVYLLVLVALAAALVSGGTFLLPFFAVLLLVLSTCWAETARFEAGVTAKLTVGAVLLLMGILALAHGMGWILPPLAAGYALLFLRHRYAYSNMTMRRRTGLLWGFYAVFAMASFLAYLPSHPLIFLFFFLLAALVVINSQFYVFLVHRLGWLYAAAAIPFHLLFHFYNGISFISGFVRHHLASFRTPAKAQTREQRLTPHV